MSIWVTEESISLKLPLEDFIVSSIFQYVHKTLWNILMLFAPKYYLSSFSLEYWGF